MKIKDTTYLISFIRDITSRKRNEKKLVEAMQKAEASDKLKSAFLANMSHEVRTPMNGILGFSTLIQDEGLEPEKRKEFSSLILNLGKHLMQIINDIIDISKIESNQLSISYSDFSLNELMIDIYTLFQHKNPEIDFSFYTELPKNSDHISSDRTRLVQILSNMLTNAFKFTEKGSIEFGYNIIQNYINFYVKDTGVGVKEEHLKIIFDRFRQSDDSVARKYGGTGLGLSISKGLVNLLGGEIGVNSDGENGSTFYFTIPCKFAGKVAEKPNVNNNIDWNNKRILVVEDDYASYQLIEVLLEVTNAKLYHVKNGNDAINFVKQNTVDLILMDVQLPGKNGNDTTREIRKFNDKIPIIAQTANAMSDDKDKSFMAGCNDYLSKPLDADLLIHTIDIYI